MPFQSQAAGAAIDMPAAPGIDEASSLSWGERVELADATDGLQCEPTNIPQWARPSLENTRIMEAMQARYLEGADALPTLTRQLFDNFDAHCTFEELYTPLEFMVVHRGDLCRYL